MYVGDKAPSPNGFTMAFYQASWGVVKTNVMRVMHYFHHNGTFAKSLNATFVVLIPKKARANEVKDFKPISIVGSMYKIISKVLANRLKKCWGVFYPSRKMPSSRVNRFWIQC